MHPFFVIFSLQNACWVFCQNRVKSALKLQKVDVRWQNFHMRHVVKFNATRRVCHCYTSSFVIFSVENTLKTLHFWGKIVLVLLLLLRKLLWLSCLWIADFCAYFETRHDSFQNIAFSGAKIMFFSLHFPFSHGLCSSNSKAK